MSHAMPSSHQRPANQIQRVPTGDPTPSTKTTSQPSTHPHIDLQYFTLRCPSTPHNQERTQRSPDPDKVAAMEKMMAPTAEEAVKALKDKDEEQEEEVAL